MVDSQFRHPKFAALLTLAGLVVALVVVMGPRGGGVTGVGDASADEDESVVTATSDPDQGDGVVFTTPGELVEVIEGPPAPGVTVGATGSTESQGSPASTSAAPPTTPTTANTTPTSAPTPASTPTSAAEPGTEPDGNNSRVDESATSDTEDQIVPVVVDSENVAAPAFSLLSVPILAGSARGGPAPDEVILGQLGTRDANSTPWMLLIGANFFIAGGALAALRLRR